MRFLTHPSKQDFVFYWFYLLSNLKLQPLTVLQHMISLQSMVEILGYPILISMGIVTLTLANWHQNEPAVTKE